MADNKNMIFQYIRNPKTRARRGVAVAVMCEDGIVRYGISLHNKHYKADPQFGIRVATERAEKSREGPVIGALNTVELVSETLTNLYRRAEHYFKDAKEFQSTQPFKITPELKASMSKQTRFLSTSRY